MGLEVTAVCSKKNFKLVSSFGKARLVDYSKIDVTREDHNYNVIFDIVNSLKFSKCKKILAPKGIFIATDVNASLIRDVALSFFSGKKAKIIMNNPKHEQVEKVMGYFGKGKLKTIVDKIFPLSEAKEAHKYSESGRAKGKILIQI